MHRFLIEAVFARIRLLHDSFFPRRIARHFRIIVGIER